MDRLYLFIQVNTGIHKYLVIYHLRIEVSHWFYKGVTPCTVNVLKFRMLVACQTGLKNSAYPEQTASFQKQSDQCLPCLLS